MDNKLQEWTAPQLMRLNQVDGTEGGTAIFLTEGVNCTTQNPGCNANAPS